MLFLLGFLPATLQHSVSIQADPFAVMAKLKDTAGYQQWLLNNQGNVRIENSAATSVAIEVQQPPNRVVYSLEILPSVEQNQTLVRSSTRANYWVKCLYALGLTQTHKVLTSRLKQVMEDPSRRYGFDINLESVQDSLIITAKDLVAGKIVRFIEDSLFQMLRKTIIAHSPQHEISYCYTSSVAVPGSNTELAVGIPVPERPKEPGAFQVLVLPPRGRVLIGRSKLQDRERLIKAMNDYVYDHRLKRVAQAMEQYPVNDAGIIRNPDQALSVILPVY